MFPIDSHNRGIKDHEKQIMSNALCKWENFYIKSTNLHVCL